MVRNMSKILATISVALMVMVFSSVAQAADDAAMHEQIQKALDMQCKASSDPKVVKSTGMECVSANLSADNKAIVMTYRVTNDAIATNLAGDNVADALKAGACAQPQMKAMLKILESIEMTYLDKNDKSIVSVKITEC